MNALKGFIPTALALSLLWGCGHQQPAPSARASGTTPPTAPAPQAAKILPDWADKFNRACAMLGKPKREFYDAFGIPTEINAMTGMYSYRTGFWVLTINFGDGKVSDCTLTFDKDQPIPGELPKYSKDILIGASDVWEAVGAAGSKPDSCYINGLFMQSSAPYGGEQKTTWDVSPSGMSGKSKGDQEIFLSLGKIMGLNAPSANYMVCQQKFNPDTNGFDAAGCTPKPGFDWKLRQVTAVTTNPKVLVNEDYTGTKYVKYPVP